MRKTLKRRIEAIGRLITQADPAERKAFLKPAPTAVVAYYAGNLQPNETEPLEAVVRALKYPNLRAHYEDLKRNNITEIKRRYDKALRPVFEKFGFDYFPHEKWEEGIAKLAEQLPPEWREWIQREEYEGDLDFVTLRRVIDARKISRASVNSAYFRKSIDTSACGKIEPR
jgi:hypothetical protein